jgi:hypothetical protein
MLFKRFAAALSALAAGIILSAFSAQTAQATCYVPYCWGAIAINTGQWGWSVNHATRGEAHAAANSRCGYRCNRTLTFQNQCGAYALAANGGWGWATRYSRYAAEAEALRQCRIYNPGRGCQVRVWACTSRR